MLTLEVEMYVGKQKYLNHKVSAVDIPFNEIILHLKQFPKIYRFLFYNITDMFKSVINMIGDNPV